MSFIPSTSPLLKVWASSASDRFLWQQGLTQKCRLKTWIWVPGRKGPHVVDARGENTGERPMVLTMLWIPLGCETPSGWKGPDFKLCSRLHGRCQLRSGAKLATIMTCV